MKKNANYREKKYERMDEARVRGTIARHLAREKDWSKLTKRKLRELCQLEIDTDLALCKKQFNEMVDKDDMLTL